MFYLQTRALRVNHSPDQLLRTDTPPKVNKIWTFCT